MARIVGSFEGPPLVIRASRMKIASGVVGCAAFVLLGFLLARNADDVQGVAVGWFCVATFGALALLGLPKLVWPDRLTLSPGGLRLDTLFGTAIEARWRDVGVISVSSVLGARSVAFDVARENGAKVRLRGLTKAITQYDVGLTSAWPMKTEELARLLSEARAEWSAGGA